MAVSDARGFADQLAARGDDDLARLLQVRRVPPSAAWADFFDAAEAMLEPASLAWGLAALTRAEADALAEALRTGAPVAEGPARDALAAYGLGNADGIPFAAVARAWPPGPVDGSDRDTPAEGENPAEGAQPATEDAPATDDKPTPGDEPATGDTPATDKSDAPSAESDAHAAERAFAASAALAEILQLALAAPLARVGSGTLGAADRRRLVDSGAVQDGDEAEELLAIADLAGLVASVDRRWLVTEAGRAWTHEGAVRRWHLVARAVRDALPDGVRVRDAGWMPLAQWRGAYPFDLTWPDRSDRLRALLRRWAMVIGDTPPAWAAGLAAGEGADEQALQALVPSEVDRLYLQNDLTAIAPGPLAPQLDVRLRMMARRESRAQASMYRFTAETIDAALAAGETAASLRAFLGSLSLTGLPQPLAYEIDRAAARHGSLRVGPDASGRTRVSGDAELLQTAVVDQSLRPLGLITDADGTLVTRTAPETAFWMLADARYPVVAVDVDGMTRVLDRHRLAPSTPGPDAGDVYRPLIDRLRAAHGEDADAAWLGRELEHAVRTRAVMTVVVRLPDGSERPFTMEVTGLGGGRLRGRDQGADVERTLPVASIVSIRSA
ncbi:helicase-associated domain-containing protein [Microbacterium sp.]|uniref:helicase-associated domain-containing protein n=1 Tax=Microbacterium sp. TaxID=51671 RepID=UPI0039E3CD2F